VVTKKVDRVKIESNLGGGTTTAQKYMSIGSFESYGRGPSNAPGIILNR
jgi:hypothetical protein